MRSRCPSTVAVVYFKSQDDGDGTYEGQIGHAYLHPDDESTEDEEHDLGFQDQQGSDRLWSTVASDVSCLFALATNVDTARQQENEQHDD